MELKRLPAAFYQSPSGNEPVRDWLLALDPKSRRIVGRDIATADTEDPETRRGAGEATSKGNHIMTQKKGRIGSSFEDYLAGQGTLEETTASAVKRVLAWQLEQAMERQQITKSAMARAMRTSRSQLDRILDPDNDHIRLDTLTAAANVLGLNLRIELIG